MKLPIIGSAQQTVLYQTPKTHKLYHFINTVENQPLLHDFSVTLEKNGFNQHFSDKFIFASHSQKSPLRLVQYC